MDLKPSPGFSDHFSGRKTGELLYPVLARRSGGLSLGVNLFPDAKRCSFDCPYCEIFPFPPGPGFRPEALRAALDAWCREAEATSARPPVRDICLSGNGEPSLSPFLGEALELCAAARRAWPRVLGEAKLVLITNSTGFGLPAVSSLLAEGVSREGLEIWAKLDAGSEAQFARMSRSSWTLADLVADLLAFARVSPLVLQTMFCAFGAEQTPLSEMEAWAALVARLVAEGARIKEVQIYTQARPAPEGLTGPLAEEGLRLAASLLRTALSGAALSGAALSGAALPGAALPGAAVGTVAGAGSRNRAGPPSIRIFGREGEIE
jgi:histidinol dehydrogenase